ncbi:Dual specificity phosphatase catalytic domain [Trypanosoma vivax]|uniref:protein-tyrosine-phosphatase n=1 Tax=Trypanosoma vivax (strain Y486) TaxID=1055687 RepID=G0U2W4_TRYVY|nr:putative kinetoplastid-specific dual specificity phosphatase [Trypanosoma vivax]KAH8604257.1 Dual specificity phosphatase catalytic domain [Trypanosoma vivax]CCC50618.1 putative kinetoplastid-specific dual specificity phosphatase [Trypanosoma vivax Y486]
MAIRSCSRSRDSVSPGGTPFVCHRRLSDCSTEVSCSPSTPRATVATPAFNFDAVLSPREITGMTDRRSSQLMTPKRGPASSVQMQAVLRTPQLTGEELRLRALLDTELALNKIDSLGNGSPAVTSLGNGLYVGRFPDEETLEILRRECVDVIINCCAGEYDSREVVSPEFEVHDLCAEDLNDYLILFHCYDRFSEIVSRAQRDGRRVFVHCIAGVNRSVTLCIAYMMQHYRMDPVSCVQHFRANGRVNILDNVGFRHQLVDFYLNPTCV